MWLEKPIGHVRTKYAGVQPRIADEGQVSQKTLAQKLSMQRTGRCQMCGKTIEKHGITLVVDHKKPRYWATPMIGKIYGRSAEDCNGGKKAYFSSLNVSPELMKSVIAHDSVHVRIGELLKAVGVGKRTPSALLEVVADQDDWQKRLRELRYPVIGWDIGTLGYKAPSGRKQMDYILRSFQPWPPDPTGVIRRFEKERELKNRAKSK